MTWHSSHLDRFLTAIFHFWFKRGPDFAPVVMATATPSVEQDLDRRLTDVEYWQGRLGLWVRELHESLGEEVSNEVLRAWIREL